MSKGARGIWAKGIAFVSSQGSEKVCGDVRGPGTCHVLGRCLVGVGMWHLFALTLNVSLSSLVFQDRLVFIYC